MKTIKDRIAKWSAIGLLSAVAATSFYAPNASAHGEKSQAAFMRMRTIHWYDLTWSKEKVKVNETVEIKGKFHVFEGWPETVDEPDVAFLNVGMPGPVFIRKESYIGGQLVPRSVRLEIGKTYDFRVVLKARRPGDWHVHTMMNVQGGGPIIGPGKWITVEGSMSEFRNPVTTLTGQTVDLENYNEGNTYFWHAFWFAIGVAWIGYWSRRPIFIPRLLMVDAGRADELVSTTDRKVAMGFLAATILIVVMAMSSANSKYPITIPLQAGTMRGMKPIDMPAPTVSVKVEDATYRVPGRAMRMKLTITNHGNRPIRLGEFYTASVRFLDSNVYKDTTGYPEDLLAEDGLSVSDNSPLAPGETRTVDVTASDAAWEVYRLSDIIYDPDSRFAGLLFFFDDQGNRQVTQIDAPLIPSFM
ncbi:bacterial ammonia monooxygenase, subunit AmoB [Methylococcus geothermalis]|uniref:Methane monooxygenase/ammonia monooxygenase subunit B n=1 Tax=Methylococcus geothermalis TaxID=2681310 RepID=A0A858Q5Q5_9GAMM|nr:bacterial ammonia monooxygenase, subunit AmoB [Methylococcus geothermalis]QIT07173.1 methane monooxygenase subunit B [Methylococcus geothermalis]QIT07174.1 methane monooxygenase subunit B [Methylococcus geothermalis]QJD29135.1 methane monooxygenase/ammonia monooxygenase subunit B [Methylococcus geothermalis]QJD30213.1 methane monooxygenase/ammonia monooxygenase subunit B [Methylococcus geothermalis]